MNLHPEAISLESFDRIMDSVFIHLSWVDPLYWEAIEAEAKRLEENARASYERTRLRKEGKLEPATPRRRADRKKLEE
jgi:hypothetical protein